MNIVAAQRNITEYHLALSEADAREAVESPYIFADRLAEQLRAAGVVPTSANGHQPRAKPKLNQQLVIGNGRTSRKAKAAKRPNGTAGDSLARLRCPECQQEIAKKYLPLHRLKKHGLPVESAVSAAKSVSTD